MFCLISTIMLSEEKISTQNLALDLEDHAIGRDDFDYEDEAANLNQPEILKPHRVNEFKVS